MEAQQALQILDQAAAGTATTRDGHRALVEAVNKFHELIDESARAQVAAKGRAKLKADVAKLRKELRQLKKAKK